jgi:hypothetical protein
MGMYTEFHFNAELKQNVPLEVIAVLRFMLSNDKEYAGKLPDSPLFQTDRWRWMLQMNSYYFPADTHSTLRYDNIGRNYHLCIRCNLKNYDNEINKFVDWITPYLDVASDQDEFVGFQRYEERREPSLIFVRGTV